MKIAFTGHRHLKYSDVEHALVRVAFKYPGAIWITGGAVGLDSHAARYAMEHGITLWLILPFSPYVMTKFWTNAQRELLLKSVRYASKLSVLSPEYHVRYYQLRNERMVDLADLVIAFFDGSPGGTANCVHYAESVSKELVRIPDLPSTTKITGLGLPAPRARCSVGALKGLPCGVLRIGQRPTNH